MICIGMICIDMMCIGMICIDMMCMKYIKNQWVAENLGSEFKGKGKGKANPLQALTGPEGSRKLKLPDFKTVGT
jgi:hypothetical protein